MYKNILTGIKGFFMGAANVIPGVSGGTIALITGIYEEIVDSLNALMSVKVWKSLFKDGFKNFWAQIHGTFLLSLAIGVLVSIFSLAKLAEYCLHSHPVQTWAFFFGLILASSYQMLRGIKGWTFKDVIITIIGCILGLVVCTLSPTQTPDSMWFIFLCGALAICTMILPGISGSFILVILGKYDYIMGVIDNLEVGPLVVFAAGCAIGILAFAKFLHWLLARRERETLLVLVGFVIGSLVKIWPWSDMTSIPDGGLHITGAVIWCLVGVAVIVAVEIVGRIKKRS